MESVSAFALVWMLMGVEPQVQPPMQTVQSQLHVININEADARTIAVALNGISLKGARAIVTYRAVNGPFSSVEDVATVPGISREQVAQNANRITVFPLE